MRQNKQALQRVTKRRERYVGKKKKKRVLVGGIAEKNKGW